MSRPEPLGERITGVAALASRPGRAEVDLGDSILSLYGRRDGTQTLGLFGGNEHAGWPASLGRHPSNALPLAAAGAALPCAWEEVESIQQSTNDILSFGSTISNAAGKAIFSAENWLGLPFRYIHDDSVQTRKVWRWVGGRWYSTVLRQADLGDGLGLESPLPKEADRDYDFGADRHRLLLNSDLLILTVIPNAVDERAFRLDGKMVFVGGVHGIATEAFPAMLSDKAVVEDIRNRVGGADFFQVAIRANRIHHDPPGETGRSWADPDEFEVIAGKRLQAGDLYAHIAQHNGWRSL